MCSPVEIRSRNIFELLLSEILNELRLSLWMGGTHPLEEAIGGDPLLWFGEEDTADRQA